MPLDARGKERIDGFPVPVVGITEAHHCSRHNIADDYLTYGSRYLPSSSTARSHPSTTPDSCPAGLLDVSCLGPGIPLASLDTNSGTNQSSPSHDLAMQISD